MANKKITELTELSSISEDTFPIPIVDTDATETKKVTLATLKAFMSASPTLVTPNLGTPSAGDISACTGSPTLTNVHVTGMMHITGTLQSNIVEDVGADPAGSVTLLPSAIGVAVAESTYKYAPLVSSPTPTGSGAMVLATSPTLVSPALGTPASGNLVNCVIPAGYKLSGDTGTAGQMSYDSGFLYVCVATNLWKYVALSTIPDP